MKKIYFFLLLLIVFFPLVTLAGSYEEEIKKLSLTISKNIETTNKNTIAVVDFTDLQGNITELGRFIAEELSANLVSVKKKFKVIDRLHLKTIIAEHKLSTSWFLDPRAIEKFGKISGVDAIITGTVTPFGDSVRVSVKVITTDTAEVITAATGNIAKTKAIEELLVREIEAPETTIEKSKILRKTTKKYILGDLEFRFLKVKRIGNTLTIYVIVNNNGKKEFTLYLRPYMCCLYDDLANKYEAYKICVGRRCGSSWIVNDTIIPGVAMKISLHFKDISSEASKGTLEIPVKGEKVILRNITLK